MHHFPDDLSGLKLFARLYLGWPIGFEDINPSKATTIEPTVASRLWPSRMGDSFFELAGAMNPIHSLRARLRSLWGQPASHTRELPRRSRKPRIGASIVHVQVGLRLVVQAGMSDELWQWLMDQGWRVVTHRPERRRYLDIPASWVTRLIDADPEHRERLMHEAMQSAQSRSALARRQ